MTVLLLLLKAYQKVLVLFRKLTAKSWEFVWCSGCSSLEVRGTALMCKRCLKQFCADCYVEHLSLCGRKFVFERR